MNDSELAAHAAGIFDVAGSIYFKQGATKTKYPGISLSVGKKKIQVAEHLKERFGGSLTKRDRDGRREWVTYGTPAIEILEKINPFMKNLNKKKLVDFILKRNKEILKLKENLQEENFKFVNDFKELMQEYKRIRSNL